MVGSGSPVTAACTTTVQVTVGSMLTLANSKGALVDLGTITPGGAASVPVKDTLTVVTNNAAGYVLKLSMVGTDKNLNRDTTSGGSAATFIPTAGGAALGSASVSGWGFSQDSGTTWAAVPAVGAPVTLKTLNAPTVGDTTDVYYGAQASAAQASGVYKNDVVYTAVVN